MLIENQYFEIKWTRSNKEWYMSRGYPFTKYGDKFQVKAEDLSKGSHIKVLVECDYCGDVIEVVWKDYLKYKGEKYACGHCRQTKTSEKTLRQRQDYLYNKALDFCNRNNYQPLFSSTDISTANTIVEYICPVHGKQSTKIYALTLEHGCFECGRDIVAEKMKTDIDTVEYDILKYGGVLLNKDEYNNCMDKNLRIKCPECGNEFITSYYAYMKHNGQRCPGCTANTSKGEYIIGEYLESHNINYIPQYRFPNCKYKCTLPFDFYLVDFNILIEFDGAQHYMPVKWSSSITDDEAMENLRIVQLRDSIKTQYCIDNDINLIRIPYWEIDNINKILDNELFT